MVSRRFVLASFVLLGLALLLAFFWPQQAAPDVSEFPRLSTQAAKSRAWGALVDARPAPAFLAGSIPGAINIPAHWRGPGVEEKIQEVLARSDAGILIFCGAPPCADSLNLARRLKQAGGRNLFILRDGFTGTW
jgi:rhodanese-related sulfurtransferase